MPEESTEAILPAVGTVYTFTQCFLCWVILLELHLPPLEDSRTCLVHVGGRYALQSLNPVQPSERHTVVCSVTQLAAPGNPRGRSPTLQECMLALMLAQAKLPTGPAKPPDLPVTVGFVSPTFRRASFSRSTASLTTTQWRKRRPPGMSFFDPHQPPGPGELSSLLPFLAEKRSSFQSKHNLPSPLWVPSPHASSESLFTRASIFILSLSRRPPLG